MKQYKLIKLYPSLQLDINSVVSFDDIYDCYMGYGWTFGKEDIESFPEFWCPIEIEGNYISDYNNKNNIATIHWFNTIGGTAKHCAEFIRDNPTHENTQEYADRIVRCFEDFFTAQKQGLLKLR